MLPPEDGAKPIVLLLGEVVLAEAEWHALRAIAELRVRDKRRTFRHRLFSANTSCSKSIAEQGTNFSRTAGAAYAMESLLYHGHTTRPR